MKEHRRDLKSNPGEAVKAFATQLSTHPPIARRIRRLEAFIQ
jgi:Zn-dependent protease with chaperone function